MILLDYLIIINKEKGKYMIKNKKLFLIVLFLIPVLPITVIAEDVNSQGSTQIQPMPNQSICGRILSEQSYNYIVSRGEKNDTYESAHAIITFFNSEKNTSTILNTAAKFYTSENEFLLAMAECAEKDNLKILGALFKNQAYKKSKKEKKDFDKQLYMLALSSMTQVFCDIHVGPNEFMESPRATFTVNKDQSGKTVLDHANKIFNQTKIVFDNNRKNFMQELYNHNTKIPNGRPLLVQMFADHFNTQK